MKSDDKIYDIAAFGEILIDFTGEGVNEAGQMVFARNPGGAPANVAVAAARLGMRTAFLGKVGKDMQGAFLKETLDREGVETAGLVMDPDWFTTLAFVELDEHGERHFSFARKPGADVMIRKEELNLEILDRSWILHVGSLSLTGEPARETTFAAVKRARDHGSIIAYDPNYRASLWDSEEDAKVHMRSILPYVDLLKISDEETVLLTGEGDVEKAAEKLVGQGIPVVAVTLGSKGAYVRNKEGGRLVPGFASSVTDTTGAGDSFWGGFLSQICSRLCDKAAGKQPDDLNLEELAECARFGNAVASLCVEKKGAIPAMPYPEQVRQRLEQGGAERVAE